MRNSLGKIASVAVVALAFGLFHFSSFRMVLTTGLGLLLGLLAVQFRSIWPPIIAHAMHNSMSLLALHPHALRPWFDRQHFDLESPPTQWVLVAAGAVALGVILSLIPTRARTGGPERAAALATAIH